MKQPYEIEAKLNGTSHTAVRSVKREAIRECHRMMRKLGEGTHGSVRREGFGYVIQQRLEQKNNRLAFITEEL
jgi:hypothetical protein